MGVTFRSWLLTAVLLVTANAADVTIDGQWAPIEPTPQPTKLIESPFALELDAGPDQFVTWTWDQGLSVWKSQENRLEVEAPAGVYRVGWTVRRINFEAGRIDTESGSLIFKTATGEPGKPDDPGEPPADPGIGDKRITDLAKAAIRETRDNQTALALGKFYVEWSASADKTASKEALRDSLRRGTGGVLLRRSGDADWESAWRVPLSAILNGATAAEYVGLVGFAGRQLIAAGSQSIQRVEKTQPKTVTMFTRAGCEPCQRWKRDVKPIFERSGFLVREVTAPAGAVIPYFRIEYQGESYTHEGFLEVSKFNRMLEERRRK